MNNEPSKRIYYLHRIVMVFLMSYDDESEEMKMREHIEPLAQDVIASLESFVKEKGGELSAQDMNRLVRILKKLRTLFASKYVTHKCTHLNTCHPFPEASREQPAPCSACRRSCTPSSSSAKTRPQRSPAPCESPSSDPQYPP